MNKPALLFFLLATLLFSSCATRKDLIYLRDMEELKEYPVFQKYEPVIHRDDRLSITVSCKNPELTLPFNIPGVVITVLVWMGISPLPLLPVVPTMPARVT